MPDQIQDFHALAMEPEFHRLIEEPEAYLKKGLKQIDSRLLKAALTIESESFVDMMLKGLNPALIRIMKADIELLVQEGKVTREDAVKAQHDVLDTYNEIRLREAASGATA